MWNQTYKALGPRSQGSGGSGGVVLIGPDNFTSYASVSGDLNCQAQLVTSGPYSLLEYDLDLCQILTYPGDGAKKCFALHYTVTETTDKLHFNFPASTAWITAEWYEWRSSTFDFASTKDTRFPSYRNDNPGDTVNVDLYSGFSAGTITTGVDDCAKAGVYVQGDSFNANPGDANTIDEQSFVLLRATPYYIKHEVKLNSPNTANGICEAVITNLSSNAVTTLGHRNMKIVADGVPQCYMRRMQWGMAATAGSGPGATFADTSIIYRTGLKIVRFG